MSLRDCSLAIAPSCWPAPLHEQCTTYSFHVLFWRDSAHNLMISFFFGANSAQPDPRSAFACALAARGFLGCVWGALNVGQRLQAADCRERQSEGPELCRGTAAGLLLFPTDNYLFTTDNYVCWCLTLTTTVLCLYSGSPVVKALQMWHRLSRARGQ